MKIRYLFILFTAALAGAGGALANTFTVGNSGASAYVINGVNNPSLTLYRGRTYTFNINASGHPFWIKTNAVTGSAYTNGVTGNGTAIGVLTFAVPTNAPATLRYICQFHGAMTGTLNIENSPQRGWWRFEEVGATVQDFSGYGLTGVVVSMNSGIDDGASGYSTDVPGARIVHGNLTNDNIRSLRFSKSGGRVHIVEPTRFDLTNHPAAFTVEAFIKINRPEYPMRLFDARRVGLPEPPPRTVISPFLSALNPLPLMAMSVHSDLTTNYVTLFASGAFNPSPLTPGHWHHVAFVQNNTSALFYVDYQLAGGSPLISAGYEPGPFNDINEVSLGAIAGQEFNNFDGWLDEIRVTDRALAPTQFLRVVGGLAPGIRDFPSPENPAQVTVVSELGERYQLQGTTNLLAAPQVWNNVTTVVTGNQFYTTFGVGGAPANVYRVIKNP